MRNSFSVNSAKAAMVASTRSVLANVDDKQEPLGTAARPFYPPRAERASAPLQFRYGNANLAALSGSQPTQDRQQSLHVRGQRALEAKLLARDRMLEPQNGCMQRLARKRRHRRRGFLRIGAFGLERTLLAVERIADQRRAEM